MLSLTNKHDCTKCRLFKEGAPLYKGVPLPRQNNNEKIVVILTDRAYTATYAYSEEQRNILQEACSALDVDRVVYIPAVFCGHTKTPTKLMMKKCSSRVKEQLESVKPNVIVCLGKGPATLFNITGKLNKILVGMFDVEGLPKVNGVNPKLIVTQNLDKVLEDYSLREQLAADLKKAQKLCSVSEITVPENYYLIESPEEWEASVDKLIAVADTHIVAADIETNGKPGRNGDGRMRCISFCWAPGYAFCVPFELDPEGYLHGLKRLFTSNVKFIWHNSLFDVPFLRSVYGLNSDHNYADTMLDAYLLQPGKGKYGYGLKGLALQYTDLGAYDTEIHTLDEDDDSGLNMWERVPLETLATYNCGDVDATRQIFGIFRKKLAEKNMLTLSKVMMESALVVMDLENNGCLIDQEMIANFVPRLDAIISQYIKELDAFVGKHIDWDSPKELGTLLYDELKYKPPFKSTDGKAANLTDDTALEIINTPLTQLLRKYRRATKLCNTYYKGYFSKLESDGRLHGHYWLNETATCRLSSSDPNLQNLPRGMAKTDPGYDDLHEFKVKNAIIAPPGWTLVAADQSQAEMRVAAILSKDPELMGLYRNGLDLHSKNAKVCFDIKVDMTNIDTELKAKGLKEGTTEYKIERERKELKYIKENYPAERTAAKSVSFGILYGMSEWGLKFDLDGKTRAQGKVWDVEQCRTLIRRFHENFRVLSKWLDECKRFAHAHKYIANPFGFRRPLPEIVSPNYRDRAGADRKAVNTPVQGAASTIMVLGIATARRRLDPQRAHLIITVHDSVVVEVRNDYVQEAIKIIQDSLTHPVFEGKPIPFLTVPLVVDIETGLRYGSLQEV